MGAKRGLVRSTEFRIERLFYFLTRTKREYLPFFILIQERRIHHEHQTAA
jgi:hypothetical protein